MRNNYWSNNTRLKRILVLALLMHQILSFLSFDRLGPVNVRNIIDYSNYSDIKLKDTPIEYKCFLEECFYKKIIKRISLESYSLDYIEKKLDSTFSLLKRSSDMGIKVLSINDDSCCPYFIRFPLIKSMHEKLKLSINLKEYISFI